MATEPQATNGQPVVLSDGSLTFKIRRKDSEKTVDLDLLVLKLCCEGCENDHHLAVKDGMVQPTSQFLMDLAGRLEGIGVDGCTPSIAWQMWLASIDGMEYLKKSTNGMPNSLSGTASTQEPSPEQKSSDTLQT